MPRLVRIATLALTLALPAAAPAQEGAENVPSPGSPPEGRHAPDSGEAGEPDAIPEPAMTLERMERILRALAPGLQGDGTAWQMRIEGITVIVVTDAEADRMRVLAPVRPADAVGEEEMTRLMQANFDSALDARYAIAKGTLWAAYIHPLSPLEKTQLISGLGQVVNLVRTYGTLYSGGAMQFGGGDSRDLQRELIDDLLKRGEEI